jgi:protein subunit release factor B
MGNRTKLFSVTIKDCKVETFSVGGAGGGGKDTSNTGVRISHPPSGAVGVGVDHRSQLKNKQDAFRRMGESKQFQVWAKLKASTTPGQKTIDEMINELLQPENIKEETYCPYCLTPGSGIMSTGSEMDVCFCKRK